MAFGYKVILTGTALVAAAVLAPSACQEAGRAGLRA